MTLERIEHKVFASEAPLDEMGQFGSALATTKLNTKDVAEIQALPAYTKGWGSAIISENNYPAMEEMNGVLNVMSYHTGYLYQEGVPVYSPTQTYSATSWVKTITGEKIYRSKQDENKGNDLEDTAWWEELKLGGGGGLEIGDIGIAPLGIDEAKGKRRYLNGQLIIQEQYVQFTNKVKSAVALYPSLACTESEWQTTALLSVGGQVGKFVVDNEAGTIRLPKIIMPIQGLTDLSKLGEIVEAGLPNVEGSVGLYGSYGQPTDPFRWQKGAPGCGFNGDGGEGAYLFNMSWSNPIYGNSNTVQQEQIQYPYFIQVATGAEIEDNITNEIELNNPFSLLDYKYSEYELNNISWLRSNGQYNSKAIYPAVYDLLLKIYNGTETKAGVSVKLSTETFTDYDFVLNTADETFRLPIKVKLASGKAVVGNGITLGITDGNSYGGFYEDTGTNSFLNMSTDLYGANVGTISRENNLNNAKSLGVTTDPNYSGIETSDSDLYLYFYVGETVQNANLINAGRIQEKVAECITRMDCKAYITETYVNGTSGYNVYSNGYCEQWGLAVGNGDVNLTVTFLKPFKDNNYALNASIVTTSTVALGNISHVSVVSKTNTSFVTRVNSNIGLTKSWLACGYIK